MTRNTNQNSTSKQKSQSKAPAPTTRRDAFCETLEERRLLAAWSLQDQLVGLDKATQNYPAITGAGETVALIDQGVDYYHPAIAGKVIDQWNFDANSGDVFPYDNNSHGTGSAGQVAGAQRVVNGQIYQGIAPGVDLVALKASGSWNVKQAFDWVIAHKSQYNIVAVNWVDPTGGSDANVFMSELLTLKAEGVFVGGPTGNYGPAAAVVPPNHAYFQAGASTLYGGLSSITPRGPGEDLVAPGENVDVAWYYNGTHAELLSTGTSWAGPQMVGAAALIKQVNPYFTPDQIMQIMQQSASQVYDSYSNEYYPQLNVNGAIALAYQESGQAPVSTPTPVPVAPTTPVQTITGGVTNAVAGATGSFGQAFGGTPFSVGQTIQAAAYDTGGEGVGYHTISTVNENGYNAFRPGDAVGVGWTGAGGGSSFVGWTHAGEWLNYTINVATTGNYQFTSEVADANAGGAFHISVDGTNVSGTLAVPTTGSWDNYAPVTTGGVYLTAGRHTFTVAMESNGAFGYVGNFMNFSFNPAGTAVATTAGAAVGSTTQIPNAPFGLSAYAGSYSRNILAFYDNSNNETSFLVERATSYDGPYSQIATINSDANTSSGTGWHFWTDTGLTTGQTYYYRVQAVNQAGWSQFVNAYAGATAT